MHAVVMDSLEEYLSGTLEPAVERSIEAHLSTCQTCREEVRSMQDVSQLFVSLRPVEEVAPSAGFFAGVMQRVEAQRPAPSFAGLFALDFVFGRRLVFASLMMLAVLGTYLVTREVEFPAGPAPEAIMAVQQQQQELPSFVSAPPEDNMLVTLTAYEQH
jgi:anti-sigma factor RsiW